MGHLKLGKLKLANFYGFQDDLNEKLEDKVQTNSTQLNYTTHNLIQKEE